MPRAHNIRISPWYGVRLGRRTLGDGDVVKIKLTGSSRECWAEAVARVETTRGTDKTYGYRKDKHRVWFEIWVEGLEQPLTIEYPEDVREVLARFVMTAKQRKEIARV